VKLAALRNTSSGITDGTANVVPAWRIESKRKERAERIVRATATIIAHAISEGAATQ
jgi:hypothetical protein